MSAAASAPRSHKLPLTLGIAGAVGSFLLAAVVWGQTPPAAEAPKPTPAETKVPIPAPDRTAVHASRLYFVRFMAA